MPHTLGKFSSMLLRRYYTGPDHPMKLRAWSALRRACNYARLTIPFSAGAWITIDERDWLQRAILVTGVYEPEVWMALRSLADGSDVFWDIGANIGSVTIQAAMDPLIRETHAFEPDPVQAELLATHLSLNRKAKCRLHNIALSDATEYRTLSRGPRTNTGLSSLAYDVTEDSVRVRCRSLDELVFEDGLNAPTLVKIDVEGWESAVLRGATRLLADSPPKAILFETCYTDDALIQNQDLFLFLRSKGYDLWRLQRPSGEIEERENYLGVATARSPLKLSVPAVRL